MAAKLSITKEIWAEKSSGGAPGASEELDAFVADQSDWLKPYAVFCCLRDLFGHSRHMQWGTLANPTQVRNRSQPSRLSIWTGARLTRIHLPFFFLPLLPLPLCFVLG